MNPEKVLRHIVQGKKGIRFSDFIRLIEAFGFTLDRVSGAIIFSEIWFVAGGKRLKDYYISIFYNEEDEAYVADSLCQI